MLTGRSLLSTTTSFCPLLRSRPIRTRVSSSSFLPTACMLSWRHATGWILAGQREHLKSVLPRNPDPCYHCEVGVICLYLTSTRISKVDSMRKSSLLLTLFVVLSIVLAACGTPPPLRSDKYLADTSLLSQDPCAPPCFQGITAGKTTFTDALDIIKKNTTAFSNVQSQDKPPQAVWSTKDGETCCQI